jgi:hypothetical protein
MNTYAAMKLYLVKVEKKTGEEEERLKKREIFHRASNSN